ncbi:MAG: bifunctional DNA-binding transcriptional regulator/O6-methylguanine-DNA methyltransferase Ada [Roseiflexaceae bacterium]
MQPIEQQAEQEIYWQAVLSRDASQDGAFVYAVRSTGIFCRPSCPSRRPRRDQVLFFSQPAAAAQAGFRACLRCRPQDQAAPESALAEQICRILDAAEQEPSLHELGQLVALSPSHMQRIFSRVVGVSPRNYWRARRAERLRNELRSGEPVTGALFGAGYGSSGQAYSEAPGRLGMTPKAYQRGGQGMTARYTMADSPLGRLLVAATERGVCFVALGDDDQALETALRHELPAANHQRADQQLDLHVGAILAHLEGRTPRIDLPTDVQATAFQEQVWRALREIPVGETRSYAEVATAIGQPKAARAVGSACGSNPTALIVPCHRVVRSDGEPGQYRWGADRKRHLLAIEQHQE